MKRILSSLLLVLAVVSQGFSQSSAWKQVTGRELSTVVKEKDNGVYQGILYYSINVDALRSQLANATDKFSGQPGVVIQMPNLMGEFESFQVWENSNMEPSFQARFPEIRAYVGKGITDTTAQINFSVSPLGLQTMVIRADAGGAEFLERYDKAATYYQLFTSAAREQKGKFVCGTEDAGIPADLVETINNGVANKASNGVYKTMRLALSCTAEYANYFGATSSAQQSLVLAGMNATMTRVNGVFEKDLALHLNMVDNTNVLYYNPATDPYTTVANADANGNGLDDGIEPWNVELQNTLSNNLTGTGTTLAANNAAYDIGHLFGASGGGGSAGCIGCVCVNDTSSTSDRNKGAGITSPSNSIPMGDYFDIDYVAHEMGHQFGGNHSFTYGYEGSAAQVEPGSGSTIMGYAGVTSYNVQSHSDPIFCYKNISQIQTNLNTKSCPVSTNLSGTNATPTANAGSNYTIPQGTAFVLTGVATDADAGDALTYLWEENDLGTSTTTGASSRVLATKTAGPNWRTFKPSAKIERYFPQMGKIMNGTIAITTAGVANWESVSTVARTLNFTFTVRDNHTGMGQTATDATLITVSAAGGPFACTSQSTTGLAYDELTQVPVTWSVAGTTASPFNTANVDILLSTNASTALETFNLNSPTSPNPTTWTTIASNVPNNGSYTVTLPDVAATTATCRFMVKAVGNVFLAVNSKNFTINNLVASADSFGGLKNFNLYPNPNNGQFTLSFDSATTSDIEVLVHDMRGREVYKKSFANTGMFEQTLNLGGAQAGMYLVTVKDGNNKEVKKIVVE